MLPPFKVGMTANACKIKNAAVLRQVVDLLSRVVLIHLALGPYYLSVTHISNHPCNFLKKIIHLLVFGLRVSNMTKNFLFVLC